MLLATYILFNLFKHRQKQLAFDQKIKTMEFDFEAALISSQLEIQEHICQSIARDIHDNVNHTLTLAKLHLNNLTKRKHESTPSALEDAIKLLDGAISSLTVMSKGLNTEIIIEYGLLKALEDELDTIRRVNLFEVALDIQGAPIYLPDNKELIIYRIVQESFANIIKHAKATRAELTIEYLADSLLIVVQDNGKGFDPSAITGKRKAGLKNINARVRVLNGKFELKTEPGNGTTIHIQIPF
jgi:signal transduction histidine kinase